MPLNIKQLIEDESKDRDYFAMVPAMLWPDIKLCSGGSDADAVAAHAQELGVSLSVHDRWLYVTLKKICGEKGGQCFMSSRGLAKFAGMSTGQLSKSKAQLEQAGLITIVAKKRSAKGWAIDHIKVVDVWEQNIQLIKARVSVHFMNTLQEGECSHDEPKRSPDEQIGSNCSSHELHCSPGETEEEPIEEEPMVEEKQEEKPLDSGLEKMEEHWRQTDKIKSSGTNYAVPAPAGGSFALGDLLTTAACARLGRSEPKGKKHDSALAFFEKALKAEGLLQGDIATLTWAVRDWLDPEGEYAFFLPQYDLNPKHELALRHFGIVLSKAKKQAGEAADRRARDVEITEASLAALEDRRAARAPPPQDDEVGKAVKDDLEAQMGLNEFRQYVISTCFTCDDGILHVAAPDAFTRDWLENRLAVTIRRALAGVAGGPGKVAFEVDG